MIKTIKCSEGVAREARVSGEIYIHISYDCVYLFLLLFNKRIMSLSFSRVSRLCEQIRALYLTDTLYSVHAVVFPSRDCRKSARARKKFIGLEKQVARIRSLAPACAHERQN